MQYFTLDSLSILMMAVLAIVLLPVLIHSIIYFHDFKAPKGQKAIYYTALFVLTAALALGYMSNQIAMTWVLTEVTTLAAGMLIYHHREELALEAVWKYVFVCAISVTFIFIGILFWSLALYRCGSSDLSYANLMAYSDMMDPFWLKMGYIFIFCGYTAKMGLFPMFTAGIDAKDNAPGPAAAMLSSVLVNLGFVGIFRAYAVVAGSSSAQWGRILMIVTAVLTLFIATTYMVKIRNYKRMLAYSSIEHSAIVILGLCFGKVGIIFAILHLLMHTFVKGGLFLHYNQLVKVYGTKMMDKMGGYLQLNPFGAIVLLLGLFSITAIPPSGMFMSELGIFNAMIESGCWWLVVIVALFLTVLIWAICKSIIQVIFLPLKPEVAAGLNAPHLSPLRSVSQLILFGLAIYIGYACPDCITQLINDVASLIY